MATTPQFYKGDAVELQFFNSRNPITQQLETGKDELYAGAYSCFKLGEVLYDSGRSPLANAIPREIFREVFATLFDSFLLAGGLESYLTVFKTIFGEDVDVEFTIPAPGKLEIDIVASGQAFFNIIGREIQDDVYVRYNIIGRDELGDEFNITGRGIKGFETQYELEQMLFEMVPGGIYTVISLTIGG